MLDALALSSEIQTFMRDNGMGGGGGRDGFGRGGGPVDTPQARLAAAARMVQGAYQALNGGQVRGGTLYPPTQSQREQVLQARALFEQARRGMNQP
jgi:hypothetical protein